VISAAGFRQELFYQSLLHDFGNHGTIRLSVSIIGNHGTIRLSVSITGNHGTIRLSVSITGSLLYDVSLIICPVLSHFNRLVFITNYAFISPYSSSKEFRRVQPSTRLYSLSVNICEASMGDTV